MLAVAIVVDGYDSVMRGRLGGDGSRDGDDDGLLLLLTVSSDGILVAIAVASMGHDDDDDDYVTDDGLDIPDVLFLWCVGRSVDSGALSSLLLSSLQSWWCSS